MVTTECVLMNLCIFCEHFEFVPPFVHMNFFDCLPVDVSTGCPNDAVTGDRLDFSSEFLDDCRAVGASGLRPNCRSSRANIGSERFSQNFSDIF